MTTALFTHEACNGHITPDGHPERVARLHAILEALEGGEFAGLERREAPRVDLDVVRQAHPASYIAHIESRAQDAGETIARLDGDTSICSSSWEAALRAAGAVVSAVDAVMAGDVQNAFCAVRPPGHHAEPEEAMGFCLFNNIAIAAFHALVRHGLEKVAVVDFDVHHGNGTAAMFANRPECFFASSHQMPLYPGTGFAEETGCGNIVNVPLSTGARGPAFRQEWTQKIFPALDTFKPDFILVSAGFDGHKDDPLAGLDLENDDFAWITGELVAKARDLCGGRLVSTLEGGYDLEALKSAGAAHVRELMKA